MLFKAIYSFQFCYIGITTNEEIEMNLIGKTRSSEKEKREPNLAYINIYINVDVKPQ